MKKLLSFARVLTLLFALGSPAFAEDATYQNTQACLKDMAGYDNAHC
jgi:hypothetical protein